MPLRDHFRPPLDDELPWDVLHGAWAPLLAATLNQKWLPKEYVAHGLAHVGPNLEIDVATFERNGPSGPGLPNGGVATAVQAYAPPTRLAAIPTVFPDSFEVRVFTTRRGRRLVAAIELISPGNKDRPEARRAFTAKCAAYLHQGVSLVLLDVVTDRHFNLHHDLLTFLGAGPAGRLPDEAVLYASAYAPVKRGDQAEIDLWAERCEVGASLPTLPLRLTEGLFVPVELESTYTEVCRNNRLT